MTKYQILLISLSLLIACSSQPQQQTLSSAITETPALHAIQDQEVRKLMDRLNATMLERFMSEQEMDIERQKYARQMIEAANTLATTAQNLVIHLPALDLTPAEQAAFRNLAQKLGMHAGNLKTQAENQAFRGITATLHAMSSTCLACHTLFRK